MSLNGFLLFNELEATMKRKKRKNNIRENITSVSYLLFESTKKFIFFQIKVHFLHLIQNNRQFL